jgi:hypothetical protein
MGGQGKVFRWLAIIGAVVGVGLLVVGITSDSLLGTMWMIFGGTLLFTALIFLLVGRYLTGLSPESIRNGIPAMGQVLSIRDTGTTINHVNAVIAATVAVQVAGQAPYQAEVRVVLGRTQWGALQPGMLLPIVVDPAKPSRVAFDPNRAVVPAASSMAASGGGVVPPAPTGPSPAGAVHRSAADVIARGVATTGTIQAAVNTGMTASQVVGGLAPHEADDPMGQIVLTYQGPAGPLQTQMLLRVPDGKGQFLAVGATVPVRYLPEEPTVATIDWSRL